MSKNFILSIPDTLGSSLDLLQNLLQAAHMHLVIDLRFYRPEPYGLAVHIRDLFQQLIPLLQETEAYSKVTLILDQKIQDMPLAEYLPWYAQVSISPKFTIHFSSVKYYTLAEQTIFLKEINSLQPDLVYFFTFNYPILYNKKFVYQVLDLSIPKTRSLFSPKVQAMLLCLRQGLKHSTHTLFLGNNTRADAEYFADGNFTNPNKPGYKLNTVIYNGLNPIYEHTPQSDFSKASTLGQRFATSKQQEQTDLFTRLKIRKPYFLFVSVWRKYKNIERLVEAFESLQQARGHRYQLVLCGRQDAKYPEILARVQASPEYQAGNIIVAGSIPQDTDLILLQDGAEAMIAPPTSEGFGLWMVEAAVRGTPVICSDIPIFKEIAGEDGAWFFDPYDVSSILRVWLDFLDSDLDYVKSKTLTLYQITKRFRWENVAQQINQVLLTSLND